MLGGLTAALVVGLTVSKEVGQSIGLLVGLAVFVTTGWVTGLLGEPAHVDELNSPEAAFRQDHRSSVALIFFTAVVTGVAIALVAPHGERSVAFCLQNPASALLAAGTLRESDSHRLISSPDFPVASRDALAHGVGAPCASSPHAARRP